MKKNAFTLIELLAVIVILAIIALIATPIVLNIIKESKGSVTLQSATFYRDSIQNALASNMLDGNEISEGTYLIKQDGNLCLEYDFNYTCKNELELDISGQLPSDGIIKIENGKVNYLKLFYENKEIIEKQDSLIYKENLDNLPQLTFKDGNGIIDSNSNFIYSFISELDRSYHAARLNLDDYLEVSNGILEYKKNKQGNYSTGAEVILKNLVGEIVEVYTIIIFGDLNSDGFIDPNDSSMIEIFNKNKLNLNNIQLKASDVNADGVIDDTDVSIIEKDNAWVCLLNQVTRQCNNVE